MSHVKALIVVAIVALVGVGIWFVNSQAGTPGDAAAAAAASSSRSVGNNQPAISSTDSSDVALQNDMTAIDSRLTGLDQESASVDQSFNAQ